MTTWNNITDGTFPAVDSYGVGEVWIVANDDEVLPAVYFNPENDYGYFEFEEIAVEGVVSDDGISLTDLSVGAPAPASAQGALAYNNTSGVFTFTPADTYTKAEADAKYLGGLTVSTIAASGGGTLAYSSGTLSFAPCDTSAFATAADTYTETEVDNAIAAVTVNTALTGTPTAPTAGAGTNNTQVATTAYADASATAAANTAVAAAAVNYTPAATGTANDNAIDNLIAALVAIGDANGDINAVNTALSALTRSDAAP